jgi:signal transduction histidine kinase
MSASPSAYHALNQGLEAIRIRSEGLHHFTDAYRKLTRIPKPSFRKTNLKDFFQHTSILFDGTLKALNIKLEIQVPEVTVIIDPDLMDQAMINLFRNAIDALVDQAQPCIKVLVSENENVVIRIMDNGTGMDPETLENIFIPFFTTKKQGSGIGLAFTKQILQLHHAEIRVNSAVGIGTEFTILL